MHKNMILAQTFGLFVLTVVAEIVGCYLPYLWLKKNGAVWLLAPPPAVSHCLRGYCRYTTWLLLAALAARVLLS